MKNHSFILAFLLLLPSLNTFSQIRFQKGYIITNDGDTIYGELKNENNLNIYLFCVFKKDGVEKNFGPSSIKAYHYQDNRHFESQVVDSVFVQVLVSGQLSLYKHGTDFYVRKNQDELHLITPKEPELKTFERDEGHGRAYYEKLEIDNKWRGILRFLVYDCKKVYDNVQHIDFNEKNLVTLLEQYNKCKDGNGSILYDTPWSKIHYGLEGGFTHSNIFMKFEEKYFPYLDKNYSSNNPSFGAVFIFSFPRSNSNISLQTGANFLSSNFHSVKTNELSYGPIEYHIDISLKTISIPFLARYSFDFLNQELYVNCGLNLNIQAQSDAFKTTRYYSADDPEGNWTKKELFPTLSKSAIGIQYGLGYRKEFKYFSTELQLKYQINQLNHGQPITHDLKNLIVTNRCLTASLIFLLNN